MRLPRFLRHVSRVFTNPLLGTVAWLVPTLRRRTPLDASDVDAIVTFVNGAYCPSG